MIEITAAPKEPHPIRTGQAPCEVNADGMDVSNECSKPPNSIDCGGVVYCDKRMSFCLHAGGEDTCPEPPEDCPSTPTCLCLAPLDQGCSCDAVGAGALVVTCP